MDDKLLERIAEYRNNLPKCEKNRDQIVHAFNKDLFWLVNLCIQRRKTDSNLYRIKNIMSAAKYEDYEVLIKEAGPHLLECFDNIIKKEDVFGEEWMNQKISITDDKNKQQFALELFKAAREEIEKLNNSEREKIFAKVKDLLDSFLYYTEIIGKK